MRRILLVVALGGLGVAMFVPGVRWGLPSRETDRFLFGGRAVWDGATIMRLAGAWTEDPGRGADVAMNPLRDRQAAVPLNETDQQRAQIVRRWRLYSCQPDEASTMRALSMMRPRELRLDPRLYQYGGLWLYPAGGLMAAAGKLGLVELRRDLAFYLDRPEEMGKLYVVARMYSAAWGMAGIWAVYWITRRIGCGWWTAAAAAACYTMLPVVVTMAHEGKPHLAGAVLVLMTIMAATKYVESGKTKWAAAAGGLCGAATGMVLWGGVGVVVLMAMGWVGGECSVFSAQFSVKRERGRRRWAVVWATVGAAVGVYVVSNPYVVINLVVNREVLRSNLGTSTAMYHVGYQAVGRQAWHAARLAAEGTGTTAAVVGTLGAAAWLWRGRKRTMQPAAVMVMAVAVVVGVVFVVLANGKPGEYGRFALLMDIGLAIAAAATVERWTEAGMIRAGTLLLLVAGTAVAGGRYVRAYVADEGGGTRRQAAEMLAQVSAIREGTLATDAEPAPYCMPAVDLFRWRMLLAPAGASAAEWPEATVWVKAAGTAAPPPAAGGALSLYIGAWERTRILWAEEPFLLVVRPGGGGK